MRKAASLVYRLGKNGIPQSQLQSYPFPEALSSIAPVSDLVVNATSVGLPGYVPADQQADFWARLQLARGQVAYDLVYTGAGPFPTHFLLAARSAGARALDGTGMLVYQGARSFELWTGQKAPVDVMFAALAG